MVIIGQSMGGIFARKLYITACGEDEEMPLEDEIKDRIRSGLGRKQTGLLEPLEWS